jgi:hypothetical protein
LIQQLYSNKMKVKLLFQEIDEDKSGTLELEELSELTKSLGQELSPRELKVAMAAMDKDSSGEVDFDEFYVWWNEYVASGLGGGSGMESLVNKSLFAAKKQSFLGGDAELALMMAIANGRDDCRDLLVDAGADMDETMADYAKEQLRVNSAMEKKLWLQAETRRKEEEKKQPKLKLSHVPTDRSAEDVDIDRDSDIFQRFDERGRGRTVREPPGGNDEGSKTCIVQ